MFARVAYFALTASINNVFARDGLAAAVRANPHLNHYFTQKHPNRKCSSSRYTSHIHRLLRRRSHLSARIFRRIPCSRSGATQSPLRLCFFVPLLRACHRSFGIRHPQGPPFGGRLCCLMLSLFPPQEDSTFPAPRPRPGRRSSTFDSVFLLGELRLLSPHIPTRKLLEQLKACSKSRIDILPRIFLSSFVRSFLAQLSYSL